MRTHGKRSGKSSGKGRVTKTVLAYNVGRSSARQSIVSMNLRRADKRKPTAQASIRRKASELALRAIERRAIEAVSWGMPAVNFDLMLRALQRVAGAHDNTWGSDKVVYWSRPLNWKNQTLTPNPDT